MKKILFLIILLATLFRFWRLTEYPVHLSMDEVAISVAAREILHSGYDEWGNFLPLAFKSAGDYKPPVNVYLTALVQIFLGVNEFSTRFVSAFFGVLTAGVVALIAKRLEIKSWWMAGVVIAISPWHVHFSRASFEAVTGLFFATTGLLCLQYWVANKSTKYWYLSLVSFSLAVWAYHAQRVFVPLLFISLIFIYFKDFKNTFSKRLISKTFIIFIIFAVPFVLLTLFTPAVTERAKATSFMREAGFNDSLHNGNYNNIKEFIFDNDIYLIFRHWSGKYLNYFDIRYLFWKGMQFTPPSYPGIGVLYLANLPLVLLGLAKLPALKKKTRKLLYALMFLGPLPATFSINEQHPLRSLTWILFFALLIALGMDVLRKKNKKYKILKATYFIAIVFNIFYFKNIYTQQFPRLYSEPWQYGYEEISKYACAHKNDYETIFVSEAFGHEEYFTSLPQYYLAYYCGSHPFEHTEPENKRNPDNNIFIKRPLWQVDRDNYKNTLFIAAYWDFPKDLDQSRIIKKINFLNKKEGFWFVETK